MRHWLGLGMLWIAFLAGVFTGGCATARDKLLVDMPPKYACRIHGRVEKAYKVGLKYYCQKCVDENLGQAEVVVNTIPTTREEEKGNGLQVKEEEKEEGK